MKNVLGITALFLSMSILSCQDSNDVVKSPSDEVTKYRTVGMKIPTEVGARWIAAYNRKNSISGRGQGVAYSVDAAQLEASLASVNDLVGVAFHYAEDDLGNTHIIMIPIDPTMSIWTEIPGRVFVDTNTGNPISQGEANSWANRYKRNNPGMIWFHYFGRNVFDEILIIANLASMDIVPALDDLDLSPELLLVIGNTESLLENLIGGLLGGRTETTTTVYDASYPCPKCSVD
jgi:hypothetical protein